MILPLQLQHGVGRTWDGSEIMDVAVRWAKRGGLNPTKNAMMAAD
jgi:hypothetical protein